MEIHVDRGLPITENEVVEYLQSLENIQIKMASQAGHYPKAYGEPVATMAHIPNVGDIINEVEFDGKIELIPVGEGTWTHWKIEEMRVSFYREVIDLEFVVAKLHDSHARFQKVSWMWRTRFEHGIEMPPSDNAVEWAKIVAHSHPEAKEVIEAATDVVAKRPGSMGRLKRAIRALD